MCICGTGGHCGNQGQDSRLQEPNALPTEGDKFMREFERREAGEQVRKGGRVKRERLFLSEEEQTKLLDQARLVYWERLLLADLLSKHYAL